MLRGAIVPRPSLTGDDLRAMHALMVRHYDGVAWAKFMSDLAEKDGALVLRDGSGSIHGFSTYFVRDGSGPTGAYRVLFSGDTIVDAGSWGRMVTLRTLGALFAELLTTPEPPLHWLLLSKGVRTYLLLPLLFHRFCPGGGLGPGSPEHALLLHLARRRYGATFDASSSVVRPAGSADRLKPCWAQVSDARRAHPHARYFLTNNPGHVQGEELVSLAPVTPENLTDAGRRFVRPDRPRPGAASGTDDGAA